MDEYSLLSKEDLLFCMEIGKSITSKLDPDTLIETILRKVSKLIPADNWSLLLYDQNTGELYFKISIDLDLEAFSEIRLKPGEGIAGQVALTQKAMIVPDVKQNRFFTGKIDEMSGRKTKSIICVPLVFGGQTVGVLEVFNPSDLRERTTALLKVIAGYTAIAVENTRKYQKIQTLAIEDNLTGLYNTRYLYKTLKDILEVSKKTGNEFSLIFMDLDNFKRIVDTYGHSSGSQAIHEVAQTIKSAIEPPAFGVSYGGDEYVVVLPHCGKEEAFRKAEEIRLLMNDTLYLKGHDVKIQASFGVATYPEDATDLKRLLNQADKAMFKIKASGKNAVCASTE